MSVPSCQRQLIVMEDDGVFLGLKRAGAGTAFINRLETNFFVTNLLLKVRLGTFSALLAAGVAAEEASRTAQRYCGYAEVVAGASAACCALALLSPTARREHLGVGIFCALALVLVLRLVTNANVQAFGIEALCTKRIGEATSAANQAGSILGATMHDDTRDVDQNLYIPRQLEHMADMPTLGQVFRREGRLVPSRTLADKLVLVAKRPQDYLSGAESMSDAWLAQLLTQSYLSRWGDFLAPRDLPDLPARLARVPLVFDFRKEATDSRDPLWSLTRAVLELSLAIPSLVVFVDAGTGAPREAALVAIRVQGGHYFYPEDGAAWCMAKAMSTVAGFMIISAFHMAMHKLSAQQAIAAQLEVPACSDLYRALEPFGVASDGAMAELESTLVGRREKFLQVFGFFVADTDALKKVLTRIVTYMASQVQPREPAPSRAIPWYGAYEGPRYRTFHSSMARLLATAAGTGGAAPWLSRWQRLCGAKPTEADAAAGGAALLYEISVAHAEVTFLGGRVGMGALQNLGLGMIQRGLSLRPGRWRDQCSWQRCLPDLSHADFALWWVAYLSVQYGTSETSGPSVFQQISPGTSPRVAALTRRGFDRMAALTKKISSTFRGCRYRASWLDPVEEAARNFTTMTSGTYV